MNTNSQDHSRAGERRRWLAAIAAGVAGTFAWTRGQRGKSNSAGPRVANAAAPTAEAAAPMARPIKLVVRPASGAVKRHG